MASSISHCSFISTQAVCVFDSLDFEVTSNVSSYFPIADWCGAVEVGSAPKSFLLSYITTSLSDPAVAVLIDGSCGTVEVVSSFKSCL